MEISAKDVMALRQETGAGMMDCKKALIEAEGNVAKATDILREKGIAAAKKRAGRETKNGYIAVYVHPGSKLVAMVEVNCETDFVARNEQFQEFAKNLAMHIAATNPIAITPEEIDPDVVEKEREIYMAQAINEGKKPQIAEKIVEGRLNKFYAENCLLSQIYVRDEARKATIQNLLENTIAVIGENIVVNRFTRYEIGN